MFDTKEKWEYREERADGYFNYRIYPVHNAEGIASVSKKADARLIAAAPELLEACKLLFEDWLTLTEQDYNDKDENVRAIDKMVRQAIAKAEKV